MRENAAWARITVSSSSLLIRLSAARQASSSVSRTITCRRMPNLMLRPAPAPGRPKSARSPSGGDAGTECGVWGSRYFAARLRTSATFFATSAGGSPQVR
jgi:hypothetical protein